VADRLLALVLIAVSAAMIWGATLLQIQYQYEPIGPKAFPIIISALLIASALFLLIRPDPDPEIEGDGTLRRIVIAAGLLAAYVLLFERLGFIVSTALIAFGFALLLGANPWRAALFGVLLGIGSYFLFTWPLELNLPADPLFEL
jgi:putative tricarboxylic transport membrane protein